MPQNLSVIASMTNTGAINLYNMPEILDPENAARVESKRLRAQLTGLEDESFAVNWNRHQKGLLCSASQQNICVWDTEKSTEPSVKLTGAHVKDINDVNFSAHPAHGGNMMISTADDGHFKIWDLRNATSGSNDFTMTYQAAEDSLCVGQFNPINENLFAVAGDESGSISIWDMRMPGDAINTLQHHTK